MRAIFLMLACSCIFATSALADTTYIKVHFLYGSRPKREYRSIEHHWFGGIHGGHVGIEVDSNYIIDFVPAGIFHVFGHHKKLHSRFATHTVQSFWETFGGDSAEMKRTTVVIPISDVQKKQLDSLAEAYTSSTPYDYAFFGNRCAAAAYDVLAQIGVMEQHSRCGTWRRNFYPKRFRVKLLKKAKEENWTVRTIEGTERRTWESD